MIDLTKSTSAELLTLHAAIGPELRRRGIVRSENITGDVAEYIFRRAFNWTPTTNSNAHIVDAVDGDGKRFQIKGRRLTPSNRSRELGSIREMAGQHFDFPAGILFDETYGIRRASVIPHAVVLESATFVARSNSHKFILRDDIWEAPGVRDVTPELTAAARTLV